MIDTKALRQKIIELAVSGKLVAQDHSDEPATVLLERIKQEKSALIKQGKLKAIKAGSKDKQNCDSSYYKNLPKGWAVSRVGGIALSVIGGGTPDRSNEKYWGGDIPWCSVKDLGDSIYLSSTQEKITNEGLNSSAANLVMPCQLIYCTRMAVGKVRIPLTKMAINQDLKAIILGSELVPEFFAYLLSRSKIKTTGTTVKGTTIGELLNTIVLVPPTKEQIRIVSALSKLLALVEKIEEAQEKYHILSEALKQKILSLAVSGKLASSMAKNGDDKNYYWNNYKFTELKDVCDYGRSNPVKFDVLPKKMLLIELENISSGKNSLLRKIYVDPQKINLSSRVFFQKGMILYSKLRPYLDKAIIAEEPGICSGEIVPFNSYINPEFLLLFLRTKEFINQVKNSSYGVRMPRVKKLAFQTAKMPLISQVAMNETVEKWDEIESLL